VIWGLVRANCKFGFWSGHSAKPSACGPVNIEDSASGPVNFTIRLLVRSTLQFGFWSGQLYNSASGPVNFTIRLLVRSTLTE
jgi:prephenate dehydratase